MPISTQQLCDCLLQVSSLELRTNVLAAYVSGNRAHEVPAVMEAMKISSKDSFEIGFNTACGLLAAGDYVKAQSELEHAQRLGKCLPNGSTGSFCVLSRYQGLEVFSIDDVFVHSADEQAFLEALTAHSAQMRRACEYKQSVLNGCMPCCRKRDAPG